MGGGLGGEWTQLMGTLGWSLAAAAHLSPMASYGSVQMTELRPGSADRRAGLKMSFVASA